MTREDFLHKAARYILMAILALIVFALGRKVVYGSDCKGCPVYASCSKETCIK